MKKIISIIFTMMLLGCANSNQVYWCGDHPCVNKKERETFFKETMIVEVRKLTIKEKKKHSEVEKVFEQAYNKKEKKRILDEKKIAKRKKLDEKEKVKEEKRLAKQLKIERKKQLKQKKVLKKNSKKKIKHSQSTTVENSNSIFSSIVERITKRDSSKPYPDLNNVKD